MPEKGSAGLAKIRRRLADALMRLAQPPLPGPHREGMWSIPASFLYIYFGLMALLSLPPLAVIIAERIAALPGESRWLAPITVIRESAAEFGPVGLGNAIIALLIAQGGFTLMVLYYHMLNKLVAPVIKRHEDRGEAKGEAKGEARGEARGRAEANREWREWNQRRIDHEASGLPFDEPPPGE